MPNELKFTSKYTNDEADKILQGPSSSNKEMIVEFFRGITLCHQANVQKDKAGNTDQLRYIGVLHDELASLDFA